MKSWDVIVIGSGAAGFAAAVTASCKGLSVLMLEKAGQFGGTSAISGGAVWLHDTDQARAEGKSGSAEAIKTYLRTIIGEAHYREDIAEAFVRAGREALAFSSVRAVSTACVRSRPITIRMNPAQSTSVVRWRWWSMTAVNWGTRFATCARLRRGCCCLAG
ncbi:FAD-dependent oxidoreductase [Klebsiella quasipneumoniae subsp. similipneumoniae]